MNQWLLIGHRGVGKSHLANHLKDVLPEIMVLSLDHHIENAEGQSIKDIFSLHGEAFFRDLESRHLLALIQNHASQDFIIDLGAGYEGDKPPAVKALWVKRKVDSSKAVFLDRPALDGHLQMSAERFEEREKRYACWADFTLEMREGPWAFAEGEKTLFNTLFKSLELDALSNYHMTLQSTTTLDEIETLRRLQVRGFEWRDDLLKDVSPLGVESANLLVSFRSIREPNEKMSGLWDYPLEKGVNDSAPVVSLHTREGDLATTFKKFGASQQILKLAVPIHNFSELRQGHAWYLEDPSNRAFLPMSANGRWSWYRRWMASKMPLSFLRLGDGSAPDQPTVLEVLNDVKGAELFAAVIGTPVHHSFTPSFHQEYFAKKRASVFAIDINEDEFDEALPFLVTLGLRWAAVTSPLKNRAQSLLGADQAINTLFYDGESWRGTNTDGEGLRALAASSGNKRVAVWGGGGTAEALSQVFPQAAFFSSRTGLCKKGDADRVPEVLVWAVGADRFAQQGAWPPEQWPLQQVIDLNYSQDSPGRLCAHKFGCQYESGLVMFRAQAEQQQEFWDECRFK